MKPIISFVTGTRNRPADFRRMVDSIEAHTSVDWELVVSDASDSPIEEEDVATDTTWPRIHVIPERPRLGCTLGYNRAFCCTKGKWVIWLNDDAVIEPGCTQVSVAFMEAHPEIGLGAIAYAEPGRRAYSVNSYMQLPYANFGIIRRTLGDKIGWFDEDFPMYGNDNSLAFRVLMAGKGIAAVPNARIYHYATIDAHRMENNRDTERRRNDAQRLFDKYNPHFKQMQKVYEQTRLQGPFLRDQTPQWLMEQKSAQ